MRIRKVVYFFVGNVLGTGSVLGVLRLSSEVLNVYDSRTCVSGGIHRRQEATDCIALWLQPSLF